jgi:hypothetical protein
MAGQVEQRIHLMRSRRDLLKPKLAKARHQGLFIKDAKFDFDFVGIGSSH